MNASMLNEAPSTIDYKRIPLLNILDYTYDIRSSEELAEEFEVDEQFAEHLLGHFRVCIILL